MRRLEKHNFVIVAHLGTRRVRAILEGPDERTVSRERLPAVDNAILGKVNELTNEFPITDFEVVVTRAQNLKDLKDAFPEFTGWEEISPVAASSFHTWEMCNAPIEPFASL